MSEILFRPATDEERAALLRKAHVPKGTYHLRGKNAILTCVRCGKPFQARGAVLGGIAPDGTAAGVRCPACGLVADVRLVGWKP